jgi:hypothetical protein
MAVELKVEDALLRTGDRGDLRHLKCGDRGGGTGDPDREAYLI